MKTCETCGYVAQYASEEANIENWGCARAMKPKNNAYNVQVQCCSREGGVWVPPFAAEEDDGGASFKENFMKKYEEIKKNK